MDYKSDIRNSIIIPTLTYVSDTWPWNATQQSRIRAVMRYITERADCRDEIETAV